MTTKVTDKRVALVTVGARRIGAAIAERLAQDGKDVAVIDLRQADPAETVAAIEQAVGRSVGDGCDVSDAAAVKAAIGHIQSTLGAPTVLINDAGILRDDLIVKMTEDDWDAVMSVHLCGTFSLTREVQAHKVAAKCGRIVNVSSTSALGNRGQANYAATKAGMQGFAKTLAIELGRYNMMANAIAPGFIATEMLRASAERIRVTFEKYPEVATKEIAAGRPGEPEDVAAAASFFCSDEASFISGEVLPVAGGPRS